jgi:hypothetical protein
MKDLLILTKIEELDAYSHIVMIQFPKKEQFVLCASIRNTLTEIIKLTVRAGKKYYKKTTLENLDIEIEYLRSLIRKTHRLKYINTKRYEVWIRHVNEIGRMTGGWINTMNNG